MDAGQLRNQITLRRKTATRDAMGGEVITFVDVCNVAAAAQPVRGREFIALQEAASEISVKFTIYYREDIRSDWRVVWRSQEYELDAPPIDVNGEKRWHELMCRTAQT